MSPTRNLLAALTVASALTIGTFSPAFAADEHEPTAAQVTAALASSDQLEAQARTQAAGRDDLRAKLDAAALTASNKLEAYSLAVHAQEQAALDEQDAQDQLAQSQKVLDLKKASLGQWVRITYQQGLGLQGDPAFTTLLASHSQYVGTTMNVLRHLGDDQVATLAAVEAATAKQRRATAAAADAAQRASTAAVAASSAKDAADNALASQRDLLAVADSTLNDTKKSIVAARIRESALGGAVLGNAPGLLTGGTAGGTTGAIGGSTGAIGGSTGGSDGVTGKVGSCKGGQITLYRNGRIPLNALCPLAANSNQYLRADATYAFDRLSRAYVQQFGTQPCLTDSYRTYQTQVQLFRTKPGLAAKPGTSNHGWGTAVDMCGGIQNYGTTTYKWMLLNAPQFGWFHPSWARKGAGREEPWHWEFGG